MDCLSFGFHPVPLYTFLNFLFPICAQPYNAVLPQPDKKERDDLT
jgi:hypothetical protein